MRKYLRYGIAVLAVALAFGLKLLIDPLIIQETPFRLFIAAIMVSTWIGGLGPGLLATILAASITDYFFLAPRGSLSDLSLESAPLVMFVLEGSFVSFLTAALRSARKRAEENAKDALDHQEKLKDTLHMLLALHETGHVLTSSLKREEIAERLLENIKRISDFSAGVLEVPDDQGEWCVLCSVGSEDMRDWARSTPEAQAACRASLETAEPESFALPRSTPDQAPLFGLCLPLQVREHLVGLLKVYGPQTLEKRETVETLASMVHQAAIALENARLYEELAERERELHNLVGRMLVTQEEERRRVAYEVHDGLAQIAAAAHQRLQTFADLHPPDTARGQERLARALELIQRTVKEARHVIADLRPTALDDFGLATALRLHAQELSTESCRVSYEETLGDERLPVAVETALYRVAQEAVINARKHSQSSRIYMSLQRIDQAVRLEVRDWGRGFEPGVLADGGGPGERVGLSSMRERVALLGGTLRVQSKPDAGTSVVAEVPLPTNEEDAADER